MADAVRIEGLVDLRRALRDLEKSAPREFNKALKEALEPVELVASARTPRGNTGDLQRSNRIVTKGASVALRNARPYANAQHWGRRVWPSVKSPAVTPSGRRKHPSVIRPNPWFWETVEEQSDVIGRRVIRSIEVFIERRVR